LEVEVVSQSGTSTWEGKWERNIAAKEREMNLVMEMERKLEYKKRKGGWEEVKGSVQQKLRWV
jgi:hypothetical protein